ncbi:MAG: thiamine pyrophosphate-binding protein [Actinomycetota bacterium]
MAKTTGGGVIAAMLAAEGVDRVFGLPDGSYQGLIGGLDAHGIRLITPRHESSALHMAAAYARLTGRLAVAIASNGPGVANALPGVAVENAEGNRVLFITSSRRSGITYPDRGGTYQYFDQVSVIGPMAKWSASAATAERVPELLRTALRKSFSGRPGVVHFDAPESVINGKTPEPSLQAPATYRRTGSLPPSATAVERAADLLAGAKLPVIHAGGGVVHAHAFVPLVAVAEALHAPVTASWSGSGSIAHTNPLAWPITSIEATNEVRNRADVVLVLGSRLGETDWWGKAPNWASDQMVIQVDIDEEVIGMNKAVDVGIVGHVGLFLEALAEALADRPGPTAERKAAVRELQASRDEKATKITDKHMSAPTNPMGTAHVPTIARRTFDDNTIFIADGGNTAVFSAFFWQVREPGTTLGTPHFGHLGAGVGQTLGAAEAFPDRQVCCIIGDGAFGMHPQEIETAVRNGYKPVFIVISDRQWGMVKMSQSVARRPVKMIVKKQLDPDETTGTDLGEIAYDQLARAMGAHGERVSNAAQLPAAIERSLDSGKCAVIHVDVDPTKNLWAPGLLHFKKMHEEPGGK